MNFQHTEDRRMLADTLDRFIAAEYGFETRDALSRSETGFSPELWRRFAELGAVGALFAEADGGFGGAAFDISVVFECLGRGLVVEPFLGALMAGRAISLAGSDAQKARLAQLVDGSAVAAFAHGEPGTHYEPSRVVTRAARAGDGWVLSGAKAVVPHGEHADFFVVSARTSGGIDDEAGISLFIVPREAKGLTLRGYPLVDGGRGAELAFTDTQIGADALLGAEGRGFATLEAALGAGVLALCAEATGAMEIAQRDTLEYLRTRKQFGVPIGSFQALQHRMADVALEIEQARSAVINAAAALDAPRLTRGRAVSAAKYTIGRVGALVATEAVQLHGGIGMTWELPLAHYAKRLVMIDHQLGDEDHHLARYIALSKQ
ncbi:pimeloyl-CoA dehydrogenase small subunit [Trinickia terrae]|uniref:Pimeloyl-CoA dehydrogenase small subunit n=1 Tax=Trinickia terrae TaxID=2571161 RepID=A0A4U1I133_9BURK|nr:acyl-CoA dehydrogenase [Trinickia terrae]TKC86842.1 pimeloyl-CoA dehydrogenase small subunit [Trinickia terrae]